MFCRQGAVEISKIHPLLQANRVRLIGIGLEEIGLEEFLEGKFFSGELFLDLKREQYAALGMKNHSFCSLLCAMCAKSTVEFGKKGKESKLTNNLKGNWYQAGGTLVVEKGGTNVLLSYNTKDLADHVENGKILEVLGIQDVITREPGNSDKF